MDHAARRRVRRRGADPGIGVPAQVPRPDADADPAGLAVQRGIPLRVHARQAVGLLRVM